MHNVSSNIVFKQFPFDWNVPRDIVDQSKSDTLIRPRSPDACKKGRKEFWHSFPIRQVVLARLIGFDRHLILLLTLDFFLNDKTMKIERKESI